MAGLGAAMEPSAAPQEQDEPESNVTPEEQAVYDQVVNNALEIIYPKEEDELGAKVRESLTASDDPVMNLALTAVAVVSGLVASAKQANQPIPGEILFHAGAQIVELLAEAAEAFKLAEYSEDDIERAFYMAADLYREQAKAAGNLDEEALKADFEELKAADEQGRLDELLPGAIAHAEKINQRAAPAEGEEQA